MEMGTLTHQIVETRIKEEKCLDSVFNPTKPKPYYKSFCFAFTWAIFFSSLTGTVILWGTDLYNTGILKVLTFQEDGFIFNIWRKPSVDTIIAIYPFNYTNIDRLKTERPHVEEIGPYVFNEKVERVNVVFNDNGTMTFSENRTHSFDYDSSKGSLEDIIFTPNIPFLSAAAAGSKESLFKQLALAAILKGLVTKPFLEVTAEDYFMGFDDSFSIFARQISNVLHGYAPPKFGLLASRSGFSPERITIGTGIPDLNGLGMVSSYDGVTSLDYWSSDECNKITGSIGTIFPGNVVNKESRLYIYVKGFCRRIPIDFNGEFNDIQGFPAKRYELPSNIFDNATTNPENECYCSGNDCAPAGTFSISICTFDAPTFVSFPHFLNGDEQLRENVTGLSPDPEKHGFYMDIHSTLGLPVGSKSRIQLNVEVQHCPFLSQLNIIPHGTILPIAWLEISIGEMTGDIQNLIYHATYTLAYLNQALSWISLALLLISTARLLVFFIRQK